MPHTIALSVRYLAEFLLRGGSIDSRFTGLDRGALGTRLHRRLQKQGGPGYQAEIPLAIEIAQGDFVYQLAGRADGVLRSEEGVLVDEIKTTAAPLAAIQEEDNPAHWAQGMCYAHMVCVNENLPGCGVRLSYCNIDTGEIKRFTRNFTAGQLAAYVLQLLAKYERWAKMSVEWKQKRDESLKKLAFPFDAYREGQRKMAAACYRTFQQGGQLFCCAPTGIGKTLSALFPALKAMGEGYGDRVFYLTAKTIARQAAEGALVQLNAGGGLHFRSLTLTAKDKLCFLEQRDCRPEVCPYADGYYDRVGDVVYQMLQGSPAITRPVLEQAARDHSLCPYELALDLALWCDCVICDYNYLFDPTVRLQRFFESKKGEPLFLVDEAHNLVDRSREMYSARVRKSDFFALKKALPKAHKRLHSALKELNSGFVALRKLCEEEGAGVLRQNSPPKELEGPLGKFVAATEAFLEDNRGADFENDLLQLYFDTLFYQETCERYGGHYTTLVHRYGSDITVKLLCLDPSAYLSESMALGRGSVLFSATLQPLPYYRETLGGDEDARMLALQSPFAPQNLGLYVAAGISTKYAQREQSVAPVAALLAQMAGAKQGNYIAYFPSYRYMQQVLAQFEATYPHIPTLAQTSGMDEAAREEFLRAFAQGPTGTLLGFCVLGGIFAEGVDLPGNRLIGAAVVGVGLPQIGPEPDALRDYYNEKNGCGFEYAYQFPGMNKVLQAAGRVIRTPQDRGVVLLIDSRFATPRYRRMYPSHWAHWQRTHAAGLPGQLGGFWQSAP